jgi:hypothetical protein
MKDLLVDRVVQGRIGQSFADYQVAQPGGRVKGNDGVVFLVHARAPLLVVLGGHLAAASWAHRVRQADPEKVPVRAKFFAEPASRRLSLSLANPGGQSVPRAQAIDRTG